ncbi:MAG TPA: acyl carrier protein [Pseudonocardiaceae bacterium]|nr:acyl carrier protein [Pseudonocardiaceae bacterium]
MLSKDDFIRLVRDELRLPLANPDLENAFDLRVNWKSIHVVRLAVALEKRTGRKIPVTSLFKVDTIEAIYDLANQPEAA